MALLSYQTKEPSLNSTQVVAAERRWRPAPILVVTVLLHAAGLLLLLAVPAWWPWIVAVLASNHLLLSIAVLSPRGGWLGANLTRLPDAAVARRQIALTFDDGPDPEVTPQVLALLDQHNAKASFFCIGERARAHPALLREIVSRGHSVENHSFRHPHSFAFKGIAGLRREVAAAQTAIAQITGRAPAFFRAPAGFRSVLLEPVLAGQGLAYASWTRRGFDAVERDGAKVLARLTRNLAAGDILLLHDGGGNRTVLGQPMALAVLPPLLDRIAALGLQAVSLPIGCANE